MHYRFQFNLRALLTVMTAVAVIARVVRLGAPPVALLVAALACFPITATVLHRPLEGVLAIAFIIVVAIWFGMFVLAIGS